MSTMDAALWARWTERRDAEAFNELIGLYSGAVYETCRRILGNASDAEEVTQECFLQLARGRVRIRSSVGGWLYHLATCRALDRLRANKSRLANETRYSGQSPSAIDPGWDDLQHLVDEAISELPENLREPIVRHFLMRETHQAIAEGLGVSRSAVSHRIERGLDALRASLGKKGVGVGVVVLASLLSTKMAEAASLPPTLATTLGRLALAGLGPAATVGVGAWLGGKWSLASLVAAALCAATLLVAVSPSAGRDATKNTPAAPPPAIAPVMPSERVGTATATQTDRQPTEVVVGVINERPNPYEGKELTVRVYDRNEDDPAAYQAITLTIKGSELSANGADIPKGAVLMALAGDQPDNTLREAMANSIRTWAYGDNASMSFRPYSQKAILKKVVDALGQPIQGATIRVDLASTKWGSFRDIGLGKWTTKSDGSVDLPRVDGLLFLRNVIVEHPDYGVACEMFTADDRPVVTALLRANEPKAERALRGQVVGPDGKSLPNMPLEVTRVRTPGDGLIQGNANTVVTDASGRFRAYLAAGDSPYHPIEDAAPIPPHSTYGYRVKPSTKSNLVACSGQATNDEDVIIRVEEGRFHTFAFDGVPDAKWPENVKIARKDPYDSVDPDFATHAAVLRTGTYEASMLASGVTQAGDTDLKFEPVEITAESPEVVRFRLRAPMTVAGIVTDGMTGRPLRGAFVLATGGWGPDRLEDLSREQWAGLESLPEAPVDGDPRLAPLRKTSGFDGVGRTDGEGRYTIAFRPGFHAHCLVVFGRNTMVTKCYCHGSKPDERGVLDVRTIPVFGAATVVLRAVHEGASGQFLVSWKLEGSPPPWAETLANPYDGDPQQLDFVRAWHEFNSPQRLFVPAGLPLTLRLRPANPRLATVALDAPPVLSRGQTVNLGDVAIGPALQIFVRVTGSDGQPVEGVPVRKKEGNGWNVPSNTAADGVAILYVSPREKGQIGILCDDGDNPTVGEIPYDLSAPNPPATYDLSLSADDLVRVFAKH